jgi:hypothetical protein
LNSTGSTPLPDPEAHWYSARPKNAYGARFVQPARGWVRRPRRATMFCSSRRAGRSRITWCAAARRSPMCRGTSAARALRAGVNKAEHEGEAEREWRHRARHVRCARNREDGRREEADADENAGTTTLVMAAYVPPRALPAPRANVRDQHTRARAEADARTAGPSPRSRTPSPRTARQGGAPPGRPRPSRSRWLPSGLLGKRPGSGSVWADTGLRTLQAVIGRRTRAAHHGDPGPGELNEFRRGLSAVSR